MPNDLALPTLTGQIPYDVEEAINRLQNYSVELASAHDTVAERLGSLATITARLERALTVPEVGEAKLVVATIETTTLTTTTTTTSDQLVSTVSTGTPPLVVASTTLVANLNADLLDGVQGSGYALLAGRAGGQQLTGGTAAGEDLTLESTANAVKGSLLFGTSAYDEVNNRLGLGHAAPDTVLSLVATGAMGWLARARMLSGADGIITLTNAAEAAFTRLNFGGTTSSFPALTRSSTALHVRLADDSAFARITALGFDMSVLQTYTVANPAVDRALDVTGDTLAQGLAVLGTLIADLQTVGLIN